MSEETPYTPPKKERSVRAQIKGLEVGGEVAFPLTRYDYIVSCRTRLQTTTLMRFSSKMESDKNEVVITRLEDKYVPPPEEEGGEY